MSEQEKEVIKQINWQRNSFYVAALVLGLSCYTKLSQKMDDSIFIPINELRKEFSAKEIRDSVKFEVIFKQIKQANK